MKKGQVYEGMIESVEFPNKGKVFLPEEERYRALPRDHCQAGSA